MFRPRLTRKGAHFFFQTHFKEFCISVFEKTRHCGKRAHFYATHVFFGWLLDKYKFTVLRRSGALLSFVGCLTSQQHASVSQGRTCSDYFTCCHTEIEVAGQTFHLAQSQYTHTGPASPSTDPITPGAWQGSKWSANFEVTGMTRPRNNRGIRSRDLPLLRRTP